MICHLFDPIFRQKMFYIGMKYILQTGATMHHALPSHERSQTMQN